MRFGRVEGIVVPVARGSETWLALTVFLDTGSQFDVVRTETLAPLRPLATPADWTWHADQLTQETIGTDLAADGWEVIGAGDVPPHEPGALARSAIYAVRRLA